MTNLKTDHKSRTPTSTHDTDSHGDIAVAAPEREFTGSTSMIEACDRLAQKLEEVGGIVREQIQAWNQIRRPEEPNGGGHTTLPYPTVDARATQREALSDQSPRRPEAARPE